MPVRVAAPGWVSVIAWAPDPLVPPVNCEAICGPIT